MATNPELQDLLTRTGADEDLHTAIGLCVVMRGQLELALGFVLGTMSQPSGYWIFQGQSGRWNIDALRGLMAKGLVPNATTDELVGAFGRAGTLLDSLDKLERSLWGGTGGTSRRMINEWNVQSDHVTESVTDLIALRNELSQLVDELNAINVTGIAWNS